MYLLDSIAEIYVILFEHDFRFMKQKDLSDLGMDNPLRS